MRLRSVLLMFCLAWGIAGGGCDRGPAAPPDALPPTQPAVVEETRPTTQDLISGVYRKFDLPGMPLSVQAPQSWTIQTADTLTFLEGPTPADRATIQLVPHNILPIPMDRIDDVIERLRQDFDQTAAESSLKRIELREMGNVRILERISTARPVTMPQLNVRGEPEVDESGNPIMITLTPVQWNLAVFVPEGNVYRQYELNVIGLALEQYEADRELLEKIFASLRYEGAPATNPAQ